MRGHGGLFLFQNPVTILQSSRIWLVPDHLLKPAQEGIQIWRCVLASGAVLGSFDKVCCRPLDSLVTVASSSCYR